MSVSKEENNIIGIRIETARKHKGLTQTQVADYLGIKRENYTSTEIRNPSRYFKDVQILDLAKKFNVSADYLLGLVNEPSCDVKIKEICNKYGLTEKSLEAMETINNGSLIKKRRTEYNIEELNNIPTTIENTPLKTMNFLLADMLESSTNNKVSLLGLIGRILFYDDFMVDGYGFIDGKTEHLQLTGVETLTHKLILQLYNAKNSIQKEGERNEHKGKRKK